MSAFSPSLLVSVMLSSLSPDEIIHAVLQEDVKTIQGVKGIGAKTAQRVILELKDKLAKMSVDSIGNNKITGAGHNSTKDEALSALTTLGIPKNVAEKNIEAVLKNNGINLSLEQLIKLALKRA